LPDREVAFDAGQNIAPMGRGAKISLDKVPGALTRRQVTFRGDTVA